MAESKQKWPIGTCSVCGETGPITDQDLPDKRWPLDDKCRVSRNEAVKQGTSEEEWRERRKAHFARKRLPLEKNLQGLLQVYNQIVAGFDKARLSESVIADFFHIPEVARKFSYIKHRLPQSIG